MARRGPGLQIVARVSAAHGWTVASTDAAGGGVRSGFGGVREPAGSPLTPVGDHPLGDRLGEGLDGEPHQDPLDLPFALVAALDGT